LISSTVRPVHAVGDRVRGFAFRRVTPLPHMRSVAYELEHVRTRARILHVHNDDTENLFAVAFRTPPADDTGLTHILEHSVLAGSERFPLKDPFVVLTRSSMATFINAMTGIDYTVYPVASNVRRDLFNLAEVYWDAVFHPLLSLETFRREGHHLDFANRADRSSPLVVSGIVYNEMKGAYSSPDRFVTQEIFQRLYPTTCYGRSSGGDPRSIPNLTYDQFVDYYRRHYRPDNAFVFLYGDIPTEEHLAFLESRFAALEPGAPEAVFEREPAWDEPRRFVSAYPVGRADPVDRRTFHYVSWLAGDSRDVRDVLTLGILGELLVGTPAAPLYRALVESRLGEHLGSSGFFTHGLDSGFLVGLRGSEPDRAEAFERVVFDTLERCADEGFAPERVASAFHQYAYMTLEIGSRYPLQVSMSAYAQWLHGVDPLGYFRAQETLETIRDSIEGDPDLFPRLIRERLLGNAHRLSLTAAPDPEWNARRDAEQAASLESLRERLSARELDRIAEEASELERLQETPDPPEVVAKLPFLRVADLPREPTPLPVSREERGGGVTVLRSDVFANGVSYLRLSLDLASLPAELWEWMPLYARCVSKMGAGGDDFARTAERAAESTGDLRMSPATCGHASDSAACVLRATFAMKTLADSADDALALLGDVVRDLDLDDTDRLRDVLLQERATHRAQVPSAGHVYAVRRAVRGFGPLGGLADRLYGLAQPRLATRLADDLDAGVEEAAERLRAIREILRRETRMTVSFTGDDNVHDRVVAAVDRLRRLAESERGAPDSTPRSASGSASGSASASASGSAIAPAATAPEDLALEAIARSGLAAPVDVAFDALAFPAPHESAARDAGQGAALRVGALLLARGHLWEEIRAKGGAYGVRCAWNAFGGWWVLSSYRDPRILETLDVFERIPAWLESRTWPREEVERTIIAAAKDADPPIRPEAATSLALWRRLQGETDEILRERHASLLALDPDSVREAILEVFRAGMPRARVAVVAARERLEAAGLPVEDLM